MAALLVAVLFLGVVIHKKKTNRRITSAMEGVEASDGKTVCVEVDALDDVDVEGHATTAATNPNGKQI